MHIPPNEPPLLPPLSSLVGGMFTYLQTLSSLFTQVRFDAAPGGLCGFFPMHAVVANGNKAMYDRMARDPPPPFPQTQSAMNLSGVRMLCR